MTSSHNIGPLPAPDTGAMYQIHRNLFGEHVNRELYRFALTKQAHFTRSRTSPNRDYPDWRRSTVIYDDQLSEFAGMLERSIRAYLPGALPALHIPEFEVAALEIQLTNHNDGEYYRWHTDNGTQRTASRVVTFVYYFHALPKRFTGGELVLYGHDGGTSVVEPDNDTLVLFGSGTRHEVRPVSCPTRSFADGRFTVNGWVRRASRVRRDGYFDQKIFGPPVRPSSSGSILPIERPRAGSTTGERGWQSQTSCRCSTPPSPDAAAHATALLDLYSELYRQSRRAKMVDVLTAITAEEFYEGYYYASRPCVLKGRMRSSPAVREWTPQFFGQGYSAVPVQVTMHREADADYEVNFARTTRTIALGEFIQRLEAEPQSNDYYLVARNFFFDNPALQTLRKDLHPPPDIIDTDDDRRGVVKLWFGPKGTVTPLHYDEHSILFCQIYGRKHFKLIPPFDTPKLYVRQHFYSAVDPAQPDVRRYPAFLQANVVDVFLEPGDILFLPVGWWHWAKAQDISISATFCSFRVPGSNTVLATGRR